MSLVGVDLQWGRAGVSSHLCPRAVGGYTVPARPPLCFGARWEDGAWHGAGIQSVCLSACTALREDCSHGEPALRLEWGCSS